MINWQAVIANLKDGRIITVDPAKWNMDNLKYAEMVELWESNNFNTDSVRWINYYDTKELEVTIGKQVGITPLRSWISCVEPGYMTGYHYDIDDNEQEYLSRGLLKRYSIFVSEPSLGHVFILGNDYYVNKTQGTMLEWKAHNEWHNGINGGFANKYMFHILGY